MNLNKQHSYLLINDFKNANRKECIKYDKKNEKIYMELLDKAKKAENSIRNSILSVNLEVPPPPRPSNLERYNIWEKRNIMKPVIEQSEAVLFLNSRGYTLNEDYEAYQAIDLWKELKREEGIEDLPDDKTTHFDSVFTKNDTNILRRRSIHRMSSIEDSQPNNEENVVRRNTLPNSLKPRTNTIYDYNSLESNYYNENNTNYNENINYGFRQPWSDSNYEQSNIKPSAPPITHTVVYPEPDKIYYPQYNSNTNDFEV